MEEYKLVILYSIRLDFVLYCSGNEDSLQVGRYDSIFLTMSLVLHSVISAIVDLLEKKLRSIIEAFNI